MKTQIDLNVARRLAAAGMLNAVAEMVKDAHLTGRREMKAECAERVVWTKDAASKNTDDKEFRSVSHWLDQAEQRISEIDEEDRDDE